ncbi:MAG: PIN domain-containing protein [Hyphomicrobiales bacterium]|nr:PIN domain-containing protein [Hyphomicrobiales bacterium]
MTLRMLVDTCVWLDLAKDYRQQPVISALEDLIDIGEAQLLVPEIVLKEFERNKDRVAADAKRSLKSHFSLVRDAVERFGNEKDKEATLKALNEADHAAVLKGEAVNASIERIEALLTAVPALPTTDSVKARVTDRAIAQKAPYHRSKNNVGDAIIVEIYADQVTADDRSGIAFAFVTHNKRDFSQPVGDERRPHADLLPLFDSPTSTYWVSLVDLIKERDANLLANHNLEFYGFPQPRPFSEILEAEKLLFMKIWYNRHLNLRIKIERGEHQIVPEKDYIERPRRPDQTADCVWDLALDAAKSTEETVGLENLGPWDDFEWGMLNGKLSALRWALGDEWDNLDT